MSGLLRRLTRRPAATADETRPPAPEASEPAAATADPAPGGDPTTPDDQATQVLPPTGTHEVPTDPPDPSADTSIAAWAGQTGSHPAVGAGDERTADAAQPGAAGPASEQPAATPPTGTARPESGQPGGAQPESGQTDATPPAAGQTSTAQPATGQTGTTGPGGASPEAQPAPGRDLPAGVDPAELDGAPAASARRGKLRRRLRYLRRIRELLLRDLGGFTYELHRTAGGTPREAHRRLMEAKAGRLTTLDAEVRELEDRLGAPHPETVLREPGVGGTCPECGELHASDARYCSRCGNPLDAKARAERDAAIAAAAQPTTGSHETAEPQPASVLWAAGPRPRTQPEGADRTQHEAPGRPTAAVPVPIPSEAEAPADADEPAAATTDEPPADADEPAAATADEPPADADEPAAATADEPPAAGDEPKGANSGDDRPAGDGSEVGPDRPGTAAGRERDVAAGDGGDEPAGSPPNGRGEDDLPPPVTTGDPLAARRERDR